jgi:signal transduction histidine kinase
VRSIRRHLTVRLCLLAALLAACGVLAVYFLARQLLVAEFDETLAEKAQALMSVAEVDGNELEIDLDVQQFAGFGSAFSEDFFEARRGNGEVILRSTSLENQDFTFSDVPFGGDWRGDVKLPEGNGGRAAAFRFIPDGGGEGGGAFGELQLVVASDSTALRQTLRAVLLVLLVTGCVGLAAAMVLIRVGLGKGLRPLNALAEEVEELKVDEPGLRVQTKYLPDELRGVRDKLNRLLARVEESIARERRFSSHAAHELRTPLAELKIMAESIAKWPDEATSERSAEMLEVIGEIEELLEKLSLLARADAGAYALQIEPVDITASIARVLERESAAIKARGLKLQTEVQSGAFQSDPVLWQTIVGNLVGNALTYAPVNSTIQIEATPRSFAVTNPAPNLTDKDVEVMFERFWRKNTARESGIHSGLGLAIVEAAVGLLGGKCRAALAAGYLRVQVEW